MLMLASSLLFTLVDRRQLLQALLCARVRASRASEGECVHCAVLCCNVVCAGEKERLALRCDAMRCNASQAFADLFSGSAQPWGQGGSTLILVGAPSNRPQHSHSLMRTHSARATVRTTYTHTKAHTPTHA